MLKRSKRRTAQRQQNKARRDARQALRCIWCGERPASNEHIISTRFIDVLREDPRELPLPVGLNWTDPHSQKLQRRVGKKTGPGQFTLDFTSKVCKSCNNGWMNEVDDNAFLAVSSMMRGHPTTLDPDAQQAVATWIAKMALTTRFSVIASAPLNKVWTEGMLTTHSIADDWQAWVGRYDGALPLAYQPEDVRVVELRGSPPILDPPARNADVIHLNGVATSMAIGHLFVQVLGFTGEFRLVGATHQYSPRSGPAAGRSRGLLQRQSRMPLWPRSPAGSPACQARTSHGR